MDFGIGIATPHDSWTLAQRTEKLGFDHACFYDTHMITAGCSVAMGAAAMKTNRIRLGTGMPVLSHRRAAVTARDARLTSSRPASDAGVPTRSTGPRRSGHS